MLLVIEFDVKDTGIEGTRVIFAVDFGFFFQPKFERHVGHAALDEGRHFVVAQEFLAVDFDSCRIGASDRLSTGRHHSAGGGRRGQRRLGHLL